MPSKHDDLRPALPDQPDTDLPNTTATFGLLPPQRDPGLAARQVAHREVDPAEPELRMRLGPLRVEARRDGCAGRAVGGEVDAERPLRHHPGVAAAVLQVVPA